MAFEFTIKESDHVSDVFLLQSSSYADHRCEIWTSYENGMLSKEIIGNLNFSHDKFVWNTQNVLRGLHGDEHSYKLVSCPFGKVFQVAADCRPNSSTYGKYHAEEMSKENLTSMLIPPGVANGFCVLSNEALYHYKLAYPDNYLDSDEQFTVKYYDERFAIEWPVANVLLSSRDS